MRALLVEIRSSAGELRFGSARSFISLKNPLALKVKKSYVRQFEYSVMVGVKGESCSQIPTMMMIEKQGRKRFLDRRCWRTKIEFRSLFFHYFRLYFFSL